MFCSNCGKKIPADSKFCEKCGAVVEDIDELDDTLLLNKEEFKDNVVSNDEEANVIDSQSLENEELAKDIDKSEEEIVEEKLEEETKEITQEIPKKKHLSYEDDDYESEKKKLAGSHTMLLSNLDDAVADLKPDDFDELMPKSSNRRIIVVTILLILTLIGICIYFLVITPNNKKEEKPVVNYQQIINDYAKSIEKVASEYLLDHDVINDFSEIRSLVKYKDHKVSCENVYVNIDGTVYLSDCTVDGVKVEEGYGKRKNILTKNDESACNVKYDSTKGELEFYVEEELISVYSCTSSDCNLYNENDFKYNSCLDSIALIKDGNKIYLYSYEAGQELFDAFSEVIPVSIKGKINTLLVKDYLTEKYGYITLKGTSILNNEYDELGIIKDGKLLDQGIDLTNDRVVAAKNNKYGVIHLSNGKQIINFYYSDIYFAPNNNYVVKYGDKYYLVDSNDEKVLDNSYSMIFPFDDLLLVNENNKLKFINYNEKEIIEDNKNIYLPYNLRGENIGYNVYKENNVIKIDVYKSLDNVIKYEYDIDNKKLIGGEVDDTNSNSNISEE